MSTSHEESHSSPIRVLSIDDNPVFRAAIRRFFDRQPGFVLLDTLADGEAVAVLSVEVPPQVVLLDLHIGSHLSLDLIQVLQQKWSACKVIVLTFDDRPGYREAALRAGAAGFVSKLSVATELIPAMITALQTSPSGGNRDDHAGEQR